MLDLEGLALGAHLGKYLIRHELGRGGMGTVYLAEDTLLAREVALKVMLPALGADPVFSAQFREEARAVARLLHPSIVHINNFEWLEGHFVIDMEYVSGPSLECLLTAHSLHMHDLLSMVADVLQGLRMCHEHGVVHRDVKPTNILTTPEGRAKLSDFGIAKAYASRLESALSRDCSSGFYLGTPHYAPPELWEGAAPTPAWDVYSVGMVMYRALAGQLPYQGTSPFAILKKMQSQPLTPIKELAPDVSDELADCVHAMLARDPEERPTDAAAALGLLGAAPESDGVEVQDSRTLRIPQYVRRSRRRPRIWQKALGVWPVAAAVGILGATLLGAYLFTALYSDGEPHSSGRVAALEPALLPSQQEVGKTQLLSKSELLARPKRTDGPKHLFFDTALLGTDLQRNLHWMMEVPREGQDATVLAVTDRSLWFFRLSSQPNRKVSIDGHWAEYVDDAGTVFRQGTLQGSGVWNEGQILTASMLFECSTDRTTSDITLVATPHKAPVTDTGFLYALEQAPLVQPLLYRELFERRSPWGEQVAALLPAVEGARLNVPFVESPPDAVSLDGRFDEPLWKDGTSASQALPLSSGARLEARCMPEGLLLGFSVPAALGAAPTLDVTWCSELAVPLEHSTRVRVHLPWQGTPSGVRLVDGREMPWTCDWRGACAEVDGALQWEVLVPLPGPPDFRDGDTLIPTRMNAAISSRDAKGSARVLARWGGPELDEVFHGMQLVVARTREAVQP